MNLIVRRMLAFATATVLFVAHSDPRSHAYGQTVVGDADYFAQRIADATKDLDVSRLPLLSDVASETVEAIEAVELQFERMPDRDNASRWLDYLKLSALKEAIEELEDQTEPKEGRAERRKQLLSVARLDQEASKLRARLTINYPGLEYGELPALRNLVRRLDTTILIREPQRAIEAIEKEMERTAESLRELKDRDATRTPEQHVFYQLDGWCVYSAMQTKPRT
ncbi:MAG: hypothetical protein R3C05_13005 [Pirellulaceae bacterium]